MYPRFYNEYDTTHGAFHHPCEKKHTKCVNIEQGDMGMFPHCMLQPTHVSGCIVCWSQYTHSAGAWPVLNLSEPTESTMVSPRKKWC